MAQVSRDLFNELCAPPIDLRGTRDKQIRKTGNKQHKFIGFTALTTISVFINYEFYPQGENHFVHSNK